MLGIVAWVIAFALLAALAREMIKTSNQWSNRT